MNIKITFNTRYNGCYVESPDRKLNEALEEEIPELTYPLCDEDGEWTEYTIDDDIQREIESLIAANVAGPHAIVYEYDRVSS